MGITLPTFTPVEDSLFLTLYCMALDNRLPKPVLSDAMADEKSFSPGNPRSPSIRPPSASTTGS